MGRRLTRTEPIFCLNYVVSTYMVSIKEPSIHELNITDFHKNINQLYKNEIKLHIQNLKGKENQGVIANATYEKLWRDFYLQIPLHDIEILAKEVQYDSPRYLPYENYLNDFIQKINRKPIKITDSEYQNILLSFNEQMGLIQHLIQGSSESEDLTDSDIVNMYINYFPILKLSKILYCNIFFNRYLLRLYYTRPDPFDLVTYQYIRERFHSECIKQIQNNAIRFMFFDGFEYLKEYKLDNNYVLSYNNKQRLFRFLVCIKTYCKIFNIHKQKYLDFDDSGKLIKNEFQSFLSMIYYRESKKYFHKYFGINADFFKYVLSQIPNQPIEKVNEYKNLDHSTHDSNIQK